MTLSLLCDHLLLLHPEQSALIKNNQSGMSVGCLIERVNTEALVDSISIVVPNIITHCLNIGDHYTHDHI